MMRSYGRTALLSLSATLLISGLALGRWELVACIIPLSVVIFLETQFRYPARLDLMAVGRLERDEVMAGDEVGLRVALENHGPDLHGAEVRLVLDKGLRLADGPMNLPVSVRAGQTVELRWKLMVPNMGRFDIGLLEVRVNDAFHLFGASTVLPLERSLRSTPKVERLRKMALRPRVLRPFVGNLNSGVAGTGSEFHCLREYQPGDPLRQINWKATARRDELVTNSKEDERSGDLVIVLDLQKADPRVQDRSIEAAASIAQYWLGGKNRVGMIVLGDYVEVVPMGMGRRQFHRLVEKLMEVKASERDTALLADRAWKRYFPPNAVVVFISPLRSEGTSTTIKRLARDGAKVLLLSLRRKDRWNSLEEELAFRLDQIRREDLIFALGDFCRVVEWDSDTSLSRCLMGVRNW